MDTTSYLLGKKAGGGGDTPTGTIDITENGTYNVSSYASADVDVQPDLESKSVTISTNTTTTITPTQGKDGLSSVEVTTNIPQPSGTINITQNGTVDVSSYATADVNVSGGGSEDFIYPELTRVYSSSCVGGENATSITTSVNAVKDNIVYAVVTARSTITMPSGWTFLKSEKCVGDVTQTTYIYYQKVTNDGTVSLTVTQSSNVRLFLSMFAMKGSYKQASTIESGEIQFQQTPNIAEVNIENINLVEGDFLILSSVYTGLNSGSDWSMFDIYCGTTIYATTQSLKRFVIYRINENCTNLKLKAFKGNYAGSLCYIKIRPQVGTNNVNLLLDASANSILFDTIPINSSAGQIVNRIPLKVKRNSTNMSYLFGSYGYSNVTKVDFSEYDTSNATNMSNMFRETKIAHLDLSNFITTNVTNMQYMFASDSMYTSNIRYIDFSNATVTSSTNCSYMFKECCNLEFLDIRNMDVTLLSNANSTDMFKITKLSLLPTTTIIVKNDNCKTWVLNKLTSSSGFDVKTVAEYEGS